MFKKIGLVLVLILGLGFAGEIQGTTSGGAVKTIRVDNSGQLITTATTAQGLTSIVDTAVSVLATSTTLNVTNTDREYILIVNDGGTVLYLGFGAAAVSSAGVRVNASGGSYEMSGDNLFTGLITGISSATLNVVVIEGE